MKEGRDIEKVVGRKTDGKGTQGQNREGGGT